MDGRASAADINSVRFVFGDDSGDTRLSDSQRFALANAMRAEDAAYRAMRNKHGAALANRNALQPHLIGTPLRAPRNEPTRDAYRLARMRTDMIVTQIRRMLD